jgi:hypothetical protein
MHRIPILVTKCLPKELWPQQTSHLIEKLRTAYLQVFFRITSLNKQKHGAFYLLFSSSKVPSFAIVS